MYGAGVGKGKAESGHAFAGVREHIQPPAAACRLPMVVQGGGADQGDDLARSLPRLTATLPAS